MNVPGAGARRLRRRALRPAAAPVLLLGLACLLAATPSLAQLPWLDPLPTWSASDTLAHLAVGLDATHCADARTGWAADRLVVDARLPVGARGGFFVRLPWLRSDSGDLPARERWPLAAGPQAVAGWPGEAVTTGFGQLELGAVGPLSLPGLGRVGGALAVGVPLGHSRFYPWSSAGLPLRLGLSRDIGLRGGWDLSARAAVLRHGGPGTDEFSDEAFPNGWQAGTRVGRRAQRLGTFVGWDVDARGGRREQWLEFTVDVPWGTAGRVALRAAREVSGSLDRLASWRVAMSWRLSPRPTPAAPPATAED